MRGDARQLQACLGSAAACSSDSQRALATMIKEVKGKSRMEKLQAVNRFFNRWPYKLDNEIYGLREYWANPSEFMRPVR